MKSKRRQSAFTLLEVTLASAIFAGAIVVLTSAFANALTALQTMRQDSDDEPIFRFVRSLVITVPDRDNFQDGEKLDLPDEGTVTWTAVVEDTKIADLFRVVLTMNLTKKDESEPITRVETLYLLRPTWSDSDERTRLMTEATADYQSEHRTLQ
jgi:hypothetical protein